MQKCRLSADTWLTLTRSIQLLDECRNDTFGILWSNIDDADTIPTSESIVIFKQRRSIVIHVAKTASNDGLEARRC